MLFLMKVAAAAAAAAIIALTLVKQDVVTDSPVQGSNINRWLSHIFWQMSHIPLDTLGTILKCRQHMAMGSS